MPPLKKGCSKHTTRPHHLKNTALPNNDHTTFNNNTRTSKKTLPQKRLHFKIRHYLTKATLPQKAAHQQATLPHTTLQRRKTTVLSQNNYTPQTEELHRLSHASQDHTYLKKDESTSKDYTTHKIPQKDSTASKRSRYYNYTTSKIPYCCSHIHQNTFKTCLLILAWS